MASPPQGRAALTKKNQTKVEDAFAAFLDALDARPAVFPSPVRTQGRAVLAVLAAQQRADGLATAADTQRLDLHDGREVTCLALFRAYATLLLEFAEQPQRVAAYFDLRKAGRRPGAKASKDPKAGVAVAARGASRDEKARCNRLQRAFPCRNGSCNRLHRPSRDGGDPCHRL